MITSPPPRPPPARLQRQANIGSTALGGAGSAGGAIVAPPKTSSMSKESKPKAPLPPLEIYDKRNHKIWIRKELLGEGGFAKCFRVSLGRGRESTSPPLHAAGSISASNTPDSAVKVVWKASLKSGKQRQKLLSEIKIHQSLSHPNIVLFKNVFEDDENVYIILELCEQKTFVDLIKKRKRLTDSEVRFWMWQLLDGIRYMHRKGYIHRDIKLGNLFLDGKLNMKIGDFGLAAQIEHDGERKKTICGTPNYIAPEILFDTKNGHSFEVDIWSLGVVMYTLLIGKPPFQTKDVKAIYKNIRDNLYQFPENVPITPHARDIITAFLHPKPENRPSIDDVMEHPYFDRSLIPRSIPLSALVEAPVFDLKSAIIDSEASMVSNVKSPIHRLKSHVTLRSPVASTAGIGIGEPQHLPPKLPPRVQELANDPYPGKIGNINKDLPPPALPSRSMPPRAFAHSPVPLTDASPQKQLAELFSQASLKNTSPSIKNSASSWVDTPEKNRSQSNFKSGNYSSSSQRALATASENQENMSPSIRSSQNNSTALSLSLGTATVPPQSHAAPVLATLSNSSSSNSSPTTASKTTNISLKKESPLVQASKTTSALDQIYNLLKSEIKRAASLASSMKSFSTTGSVLDTVPHPSVYITKWIDYTNKYGLSYQFRDGSVGVYFNDGTSIILSNNGSSFEYLYYDRSGDRPVMHRRHHDLESPPADLSKKITLLRHFRGYMIENLTRATASSSSSDFVESGNQAPSSGMDFLTKYVRTKQGVLFRFSNHSIQLNLFDHTKLIISGGGRFITFINAQRFMESRTISDWVDSRNQEVLKRIIYCADLIEKMVLKNNKIQ